MEHRRRGPWKAGGEKGPNKDASTCERFAGKREEAYLRALAATGNYAAARAAAGNACLNTLKSHRERSTDFCLREEEAMERYRALIEAEVHHRGVTGVLEPIFWQGMIVGHVCRKSDKLLELHAKRHIRAYREHVSMETKNQHTGAVAVGLADLSKLTAQQRDLLRQLLQAGGAETGEELPEDDEAQEDEGRAGP